MNEYYRYTKISDPRSIRYYREIIDNGVLVDESRITKAMYTQVRDLAIEVTRYGNDESFVIGINRVDSEVTI